MAGKTAFSLADSVGGALIGIRETGDKARKFVRMRGLRFLCVAVAAVACFGGNPFARANSLNDLIMETVENHPRVLASEAQVGAAEDRSVEALGAWYPSLDVTASIERHRLKRSQTQTNFFPARNASLEITQLLWDFGSANAAIERARLEYTQSEITLVQVRQDLISEALAAHINLIRSAEAVVFAQRSEENIRRQTGLEEVRVELGSGLSTDLLQAKTQLAGAQARRVDAEGGLEIALNRYRAVFGYEPENIDALPGLEIATDFLPETLKSAIVEALRGNPQIQIAAIDISLAQQDRLAATADSLTPTFEIIGEHAMSQNSGGTIRRDIESSVRLELNFPFNLGFTSINTLRAAQSDIVAADRTMGDLQRSIEERVRNAWKSLETARERAGYLFDQAGIARAFLEVAIEERKLGQRSLIDLLAGETSLINAQSDAISAEADILLALVELLSASGALEYETILTVPRPDRSEMLAPIPGLHDARGPDPTMQLLTPTPDQGGVLDPSALFGDGITSPPDLLSPSAQEETDVLDPAGSSETRPAGVAPDLPEAAPPPVADPVVDPVLPDASPSPPPADASSVDPIPPEPQADTGVLDAPAPTGALPSTVLEPAPDTPPVSALEPAPSFSNQPVTDPLSETPESEGAVSVPLRDQLEALPGFDTLPRPNPPDPPPRTEPSVEEEAAPPAPPSASDDGAGVAESGLEARESNLDNPLFDWAQ